MGPTLKEGTSAIINPVSSISGTSSQKGDQILNARVYYTLLHDDPVKLKEMNLPSGSIGSVQCRIISNNFVDDSSPFVIARPMNSFVKSFPLPNEIITIYTGKSIDSTKGTGNTIVVYYYDKVVGVWDSVEHNALPDDSFFKEENSADQQNSNYNKSQIGFSSKSQEIKNPVLGEGFKEKGNIRKLKHGPGDFIFEGRFGNSIRLGGSTKVFKDYPWNGKEGSPIVLIRNGQSSGLTGNNWDPIFEDINKDGTSIALFSDQIINFYAANDNFDTYNQIEANKQQNIIQSNIVKDQPVKDANQPIPLTDITSTPNYEVSEPVKYSNTIPAENDISFVPDSEDQYDYYQEFEAPIPLRNGITRSPNFAVGRTRKYDGGTSNTNPGISYNTDQSQINDDMYYIRKFAGNVKSSVQGLTKEGRALLDLIAVTEGTIGRGKFNGYDYVIGNNTIPGFTSTDSNPPFPNISVYIKRIGQNSTAAGRYQFIYSQDWIQSGVNIYHLNGMSIYNQDFLAWNTIINKRRISISDISKMGSDFEVFKLVIGGRSDVKGPDGLSPEYASLPDSYAGVKGYYGQAGRQSFETLFSYYKEILKKY